jgi:glutaredoxin
MNFFDLIPIAGIILSNIFGLNLIYTFTSNRKGIESRDYNEVLFPVLFINNINWFMYGILYHDLYISLSCLLGTYGTFSTTIIFYKYCKTTTPSDQTLPKFTEINNQKYNKSLENLFEDKSDEISNNVKVYNSNFYNLLESYNLSIIEFILLLFLTYIILIIYLYVFIGIDTNIILNIINNSTLITHVLTFTMPFYTLRKIIKSGNTESIYTPFTFIGLVNSLLWTIYGFNQNSIYQIITNGYGIISSSVQIFITAYYCINK